MSNNRTGSLVALLVSTVLVVALLPAQPAEATRREARVVAWNNTAELADAGYRFSTAKYGYLPRNGYVVIPVTLYKGVQYAFVGAGCNDAFDIDLYIVDSARRVMGRDSRSAQWSLVKGEVPFTGRYYIVVHMAQSTADGAHYVLNVGIR